MHKRIKFSLWLLDVASFLFIDVEIEKQGHHIHIYSYIYVYSHICTLYAVRKFEYLGVISNAY